MNNNVIITFHAIKNQLWFEKTIKFLIANYKIINADELYTLLNKGSRFKKIAHLTIDDGHNSFYEIIFPILRKYNIPATLFVSPKIIAEEKNFWFQLDKELNQEKMIKIISVETKIPASKLCTIPYHFILKCLTIESIQRIIEEYYSLTNTPPVPSQNLSIDRLIEIEKTGLITIGAHTLTHPILSNESDKVTEYEISTSISQLQSILGHSIDYFAYPNGLPNLDFGNREINILRNNNIKLAFSGEARTFNWKSNTNSLPRIGFSNGNPIKLFMKIILGPNWALLKALFNQREEKLRKRIYNMI
jgi:peptidoglycan/xylan/chitin deacetylase (PgdA/CDA1 family)